jgi:hypothetical protein
MQFLAKMKNLQHQHGDCHNAYPHNRHYKLSCNLHDNEYIWLYNQHLKHEIVHNSTKDGPFVWFHTRKYDAIPSYLNG